MHSYAYVTTSMEARVEQDEWVVGELSAPTLGQVLRSVKSRGVFVLHNAIPTSVCDSLRLPLAADAQRVLESGFWPPQPERGAMGNGHINLGPPRYGCPAAFFIEPRV